MSMSAQAFYWITDILLLLILISLWVWPRRPR
jgi:hypothetical protein